MKKKELSLGELLPKQLSNFSIESCPVEKLQLSNSRSTQDLNLSLYHDQKASMDHVAEGISRLQSAFPRMSKEFFSLLFERIDENQFTIKRLEDAINHVIDNFHYREISIADVISYDKRVKLHTYNEVCDSVVSKGLTFDDYEKHTIEGKVFWIKKVDLLNNNIKL